MLLHGDLDATYTDDPRGPRYVIRSDMEENPVDVVCRFRSDGRLLHGRCRCRKRPKKNKHPLLSISAVAHFYCAINV